MDVRTEIRSILSELFNEAQPSSHFEDRVHSRLTSSMYTSPDFNYETVRDSLELIKKINFPEDKSFAVKIKKFPVTFRSEDPYSQSVSEGDELWVTIRENLITTIFFRNSWQGKKNISIKGIDHMINIKPLNRYYNDVNKNQDGTVDLNVNRLLNPEGSGSRKKIELDLPSVELGGAKWFIDEEQEELIYAKNIKNKVKFDELKEDVLEKVVNAVVS